ncbi:MAG: hypothetical protein ACTHJ3_19635 [Pararhizobium sp.]
MRFKIGIVSALVALTLTGCATSGVKPAVYPELPSDVRLCFNTEVPAPKPGALSKKQVIELIAALKQSEASKTECGKRLISFYDALSN